MNYVSPGKVKYIEIEKSYLPGPLLIWATHAGPILKILCFGGEEGKQREGGPRGSAFSPFFLSYSPCQELNLSLPSFLFFLQT